MFDRRTMIARHTWNMALAIAALTMLAVIVELLG
jgi:hypothetical protein